MNFLKDINTLAAFLTTLGMIMAAFFFMDARHIEKQAEFELKAEILDLDIKKDAETINYYRNREMTEDNLSPAEKARYEYLKSEMERKVKKKDILEQKLLELDGG